MRERGKGEEDGKERKEAASLDIWKGFGAKKKKEERNRIHQVCKPQRRENRER
jgi:hypothetical protein